MATQTPPPPSAGSPGPADAPDGGVAPSGVTGPRRAAIDARHLRTDRWWLVPTLTVTVLTAFIVYATWRAFAGVDYYAAPYVSPFYSPCLSANCVPMEAGPNVALLGEWWTLSPALIFLALPLGFRLTCYYYRKAYYRSFWASPPSCAVAEPHRSYTGETRFPLVMNNIHRYFFYPAFVISIILTYDAVLGFRNADYEWGHMGLGTVILVVNSLLVWGYTISCHSCRHIFGGRLKSFSKNPVRYRMWTWISKLNGRHAQLAWYSLFSLAIADLYVYLLATGRITDPVFF